ncbi:GAF domain-containing sensor histidine kinase [Telluribacter sp. SYSU D00476]|uniref:GAF domain-containing sensor histidine kinase n=1 Tax=Telluribacter sp. SYSU D00476 TaxID=2811430 RepID=UPI001FF26236|nr:GAF domain-containing sensor histidine kinase [Telluribacter sp. SYSU D00476]
MADIEPLNQVVRELEIEKRKNEIIRQLATEVSKPSSLKEKLDAILSVLDQRFALKHTMLLIPDENQQKLKVLSSRGFDERGIGAEVKFGEGIIGVVASRKQKLRLANISRQRKYLHTITDNKIEKAPLALPGLPDVESQVAIPLLVMEELIAVLSAESRDLNFFSPEDEEFLMTLSQLMALSIQNAIIMDQLEQKVLERTLALEQKKGELEKANASKDRLFSIIGHDLRSPAAALQQVAGLIQYYSKKGTPEQLNTTASHIVKAAKSINETLDNLLNWSVTQTGDLRMQPEKINLATEITEVVEIFEEAAHTKNISIELHTPADIVALSDRNATLTILRNLLSNALKFTRPGGQVTISVRQQDEAAEITIRDNGLGIAPENMPALFELKDHKSTPGTAKEKGTGLGLVLVKEMVHLNGGQLSMASVPGEGTTVTIHLPLSL